MELELRSEYLPEMSKEERVEVMKNRYSAKQRLSPLRREEYKQRKWEFGETMIKILNESNFEDEEIKQILIEDVKKKFCKPEEGEKEDENEE